MAPAARFAALGEVISAHQWLWREQPFKIARPGWMGRAPALASRALALDDEALPGLLADNDALIDWVAADVPSVKVLRELIDVGAPRPVVDVAGRLDWEVPGRKWGQIAWFASQVESGARPVTEWCAGKGHLGRLVASRWSVPVESLEIDSALCAEGQRLSDRLRLAQRFVCADVLDDSADLSGRHVLALHACGQLHRRLVRSARSREVAALDVAPCCYYRGEDARVEAQGLALAPDDLRLAVTETATAGAREVRLRDQAHAWRLGYAALRAELTADACWRGIKPIKPQWMAAGFEAFCRTLAARDSVVLPAAVEWSEWEAHGWTRHREVMRLSVPRFAFRRALEVWLACHLAVDLQLQGYEAGVASFCPATLTPRNLRVFARL